MLKLLVIFISFLFSCPNSANANDYILPSEYYSDKGYSIEILCRTGRSPNYIYHVVIPNTAIRIDKFVISNPDIKIDKSVNRYYTCNNGGEMIFKRSLPNVLSSPIGILGMGKEDFPFMFTYTALILMMGLAFKILFRQISP